ncbi:VOC family protein [Streptomyces sp. SPB074]|uniref:VOC family protein n=1 Tax=Streptomyces sp. (strain SPB074) TaxID=465543 RepID=UPI0001D1DFD2|nr:VOC family protein [Streptomyces sp. SPB074]EFG65056.1 glyoxalase [Streptomyces sp. SPB074]
MSSRFTELAVDCLDPRALARFWCAVLGHEVHEDEDGDYVSIGAPGTGARRPGHAPPSIGFARVPEGKAVKNRLHIDVNPSDRDQAAEAERLLALGARHVDVGAGPEVPWVVLADVEGNEFRVLGRRVE